MLAPGLRSTIRYESPIERARERAAKLARMFRENFEQFAEPAGESVTAAGPRI
jgi:ATP-dependent phosphoenolpyruvate carboxykinase